MFSCGLRLIRTEIYEHKMYTTILRVIKVDNLMTQKMTRKRITKIMFHVRVQDKKSLKIHFCLYNNNNNNTFGSLQTHRLFNII